MTSTQKTSCNTVAMTIIGEFSVRCVWAILKRSEQLLIRNDIIILKTVTNYDIYLRQGGYVFVVVCLFVCLCVC